MERTMKKQIVIIDGYNVIHSIPELKQAFEKSIESARNKLLQLCGEWLTLRRDVYMFYVVFDGDSSFRHDALQSIRNVRAVYTRSGEKADDRILDIINERGNTCAFTVVSDDNYVRKHSKELDASIMPVQKFQDTLIKKRASLTRGIHRTDGTEKTGLTTAQKKAINDELEEVWDL